MSGEQTANSADISRRRRRSNKPMMEKRRRARINQSLGQLKNLVLHVLKKDTSSGSKLEKADILEMTVNYFQELHQRHVTIKVLNDANVPNKFQAGYLECVHQVGLFLRRSSLPANEHQVQKVLSHIERQADSATGPKGEQNVSVPLNIQGAEVVFVLRANTSHPSLQQSKEQGQVNVVEQKQHDPMWRPW